MKRLWIMVGALLVIGGLYGITHPKPWLPIYSTGMHGEGPARLVVIPAGHVQVLACATLGIGVATLLLSTGTLRVFRDSDPGDYDGDAPRQYFACRNLHGQPGDPIEVFMECDSYGQTLCTIERYRDGTYSVHDLASSEEAETAIPANRARIIRRTEFQETYHRALRHLRQLA